MVSLSTCRPPSIAAVSGKKNKGWKRSGQGHAYAVSRADRQRGAIESLQAENIHSEAGRIDALAMEGVDAAAPAETMLGAHRIPLIGSELRLAGENAKRGFGHTDHQSVFPDAQGAVAGGHFNRIA